MNLARIFVPLTIVLISSTLALAIAMAESENMKVNDRVLFDFETSDELNEWRVINDGVMGGLSMGKIILSDRDTAVYQGNISFDNNGGFSSIRTTPISYRLNGFEGIILRIKGDGKTYQFRIQINDRFDGISYRYKFSTINNQWTTIKMPFNEFVPVFRGRILENVEGISPDKIQQIGFLISDKQAGSFKLELDWIRAYKK